MIHMFSIKLFKKYCRKEWMPILEANKSILHVEPGEYIFKEGSPVSGIYFIEKGNVKVLSDFGTADEKIVRLAGDGMILGHRGFNIKKYPVSAVAMTDSILTFIPISLFLDIIKANPELAIFLIDFLSDELRDAEERVKYMSVLDPKQKVAHIIERLIISFGFDHKQKNKLAFTISRKDFANMAGTTYETIIRTLSLFEKAGLIQLIGKEIAILDAPKIRQIAKGAKAAKANEID